MRIIRNRIFLKSVVIFFILEITSGIFLPAVSWALTSGPTAPEATSFEPVDTTDMVNLATGDMVYNIPLLEVPGPSGGYPLSLSYHAGIKPNEDASWVGLGWTLNPGSISRTVNGYPDDHIETVRQRTDIWTGGETHNFSLGVGYGGATVGLEVSNDTYKGVGVGAHAGYKVGFSKGPVGLSVDARVGTHPYGGSYAGANATIGLTMKNVSAGLQVSTNFKSISVKGGGAVSVGPMTARITSDGTGSISLLNMGASISSNGLRRSARIGGLEMSTNNDKAGNISSDGFGISIPIWYINVGYDYRRYYSDESSSVKTIGTLYSGQSSSKDRDDYSFDSYSLPDPDINEGHLKENDPDKARGGSFPSYDSYNVNAQGLGGSIQPYIFENGNLFRQNVDKSGHNAEFKTFGSAGSAFSKKVNFRFKNDFSNTLGYAKNEMRYENTNTYFTNTTDQLTPAEGYDAADQHLAGSKHIEWFSNLEINNGTAKTLGFIDYQPSTRALQKYSYDISKQVGGFSITNESGVTYHYGLPVYSYDEFSKTFSSESPSEAYRTNRNPHPYAYTWYLTAITGPDFVDRGGSNQAANGVLDAEDWGYWVKFEYHQQAADFQWRNPVVGYHKDIDQKFEFYSSGKKEIYYLDRISTKSHVAKFIKSVRLDGKGVTNTSNGSFLPIQVAEPYPIPDCNPGDCTDPDPRVCEDYCTGYNYYEIPSATTLKLDAIELYNAVDYSPEVTVDKAINVIGFTTDYSLCPGTLNSFEDINVEQKLGKLTLTKLEFKGKGGVGGILPPIKFGYDLEEDFKPGTIKNNALVGATNFEASTGELLKVRKGSLIAYYLVKDLGSEGYTLKFLGGDRLPDNDQWLPVLYTQTKNPPYNKDATDSWDSYKSDHEPLLSKNLEEFVTPLSALSVDVWSLRTVQTSLGSKMRINYESDTYKKPIVYKSNLLNISSVVPDVVNQELRIRFHNAGFDLSSAISPSNKLSIIGLISYPFWKQGASILNISCDGEMIGGYGETYKSVKYNAENIQITEVGADYIDVVCTDLFNDVTKVQGIHAIPVWLPYPKNNPNQPCYNGDQEALVNVQYSLQPNWMAGNLSFSSEEALTPGGGIRVKSLSIDEGGRTRTTHYEYSDGVTSFEPIGLDLEIISNVQDIINQKNDPWKAILKKREIATDAFLKELHTGVLDLLSISREIPSPYVIYSQVEVSESTVKDGNPSIAIPGKMVYEFQTFEDRHIKRTGMTASSDAGAVNCFNGDGDPVPCDPTFDEDCEDAEPGGRMCNEDRRPVDCFDTNGNPVSCGASGSTTYSPMTIDDYSAMVGSLKSIKVLGPNDQLLYQTDNNYLHDNRTIEDFTTELRTKFGNQGKTTQIFNEYRVVNGATFRVFSRKNEYPVVFLGQTQIDYKTGIKTTTRNLAFDFYTGEPTKVLATDGYGNSYVSETNPAYSVPSYSGMSSEQIASQFVGMGLKVKNQKNRNMLTQPASSYTYKVSPADENTQLGLVSASAQTWTTQIPALEPGGSIPQSANQPGIWRPHATYSFIGDDNVSLQADGLYPISNLTFNSWSKSDPVPELWQRNSEMTLYDVHSHGLEVMDLNGQYAATKMSFDQSRVMATVANAQYKEFGYSGAENFPSDGQFGLEVVPGEEYTSHAHTGDKAIVAQSGERGFTFYMAPNLKTYRVSVWANQPACKIKYILGATNPTKEASVKHVGQAGEWHLLEADIIVDNSSSQIEIWCESNSGTTHFDDFRVCPVDAVMTSYVHNKFGELWYILDGHNLFTEFEYDKMGNLKATYKESFQHPRVKVTDHEYHYANQE